MCSKLSNTAFNTCCLTSANIANMIESMKRLLLAGRELGLKNPTEVAKRLGVSQQTIKNWETRGISRDGLTRINKRMGLSIEWIETGRGPKFVGGIGNTEEATGPHRSFLYPEISDVAAGNAMEAIDLLQPGEGTRHQSDAWAGDHGFWLRVKGDSMTTAGGVSFPDGMLVLVAPDEQPESGRYIVAKIGNDVTFKQYVVDAGVRYLKPLNPAFQLQVMDDRWHVVGTVVDAKWPKSIF